MAILNFCIKCVYLGNRERYSDFDKIFDPQGMCRVYWRVFAKIVYPPLLAVILNLCVKCKDVFISEMEQVSDFDKTLVTQGYLHSLLASFH